MSSSVGAVVGLARVVCVAALIAACGSPNSDPLAETGEPDAGLMVTGTRDGGGGTKDGPSAEADGGDGVAPVDAPQSSDAPGCGQTQTDPKNCGACGRDCSALPHVRGGAPVMCMAGKCVVPTTSCDDGYAHCTASVDDVCETSLSRPEACGGCGKACLPATPLCMASADGKFSCASSCGSSTPDKCGATCVNLKTDVGSCGTCGTDCRSLPNVAGVGCEAGACKILKCKDGFADCTPEAGCETSTTDNAANCGGCGKSCSVANGTSTCAAGKCGEAVCAAGFANCDKSNPDCETQLSTSTSCGGCGVTCSGATPVCASSGGKFSCVSDCKADAPDKCGSSCVNTKTDVDRCGSCTTKCSFANAAATCANGTCQMGSCNPGFDDCNKNASDGCETSLDSNGNCGRCGNSCSFANASSSCVSRACTTPTCNAGYGNCDTKSLDCETQLNTRDHCGKCGPACGDDVPVCSTASGSGQCTTGCTASAPTRCGASCSDLKADDNNCGSCGNVCPGKCDNGTCRATWSKSAFDGKALFGP